jgi:pimeloyl-ACP methyl ester carboxylesterase
MSDPAAALLPTKTIRVAHLGATVGYHAPKTLVANKPTLVLIPGFACGATEFRPQVADAALLEVANLLVLEPLGQGATKTNSPAWTDWDSARCFLQATDALGVKKALVLGHGVGGHVAARMALYAPDKVRPPPTPPTLKLKPRTRSSASSSSARPSAPPRTASPPAGRTSRPACSACSS